jgi:hypothetical protein
MTPCIPQPPRLLLHFPLPPLQVTTFCSSCPPMHYAQTHNPTTPTALPMHHDKLLLSLRRLLRPFQGSSPFYPLCNATRQTFTLISYRTPHHRLTYLPFASSLSISRHISLLRWDIRTPQQPLTHSLLHEMSLFQTLTLLWSPVNVVSRT